MNKRKIKNLNQIKSAKKVRWFRPLNWVRDQRKKAVTVAIILLAGFKLIQHLKKHHPHMDKFL